MKLRLAVLSVFVLLLVPPARADQPTFLLPYTDGEAYRCTQGPSGSIFSHKGKTANDIDLALAVGTPVRAAAAGTAYDHPDTCPCPEPVDDRTCCPKRLDCFGKHVTVAHSCVAPHDCLFTIYAHLSKTTVRDGQHVEAGEIIGRSGCTGFATGPHIHFGLHQGDPRVGGSGLGSLSIERILARDTSDPAVGLRELRSGDFVCDGHVVGHVYEAVDGPGVDDDFNDNVLSAARWGVESAPSVGLPGTVAVRNRRLEITSAGRGGAGIFSRCSLGGDFDVEVAYTLLNWPANNHHSVMLRALGLGQGGPNGPPGPFRFSGVPEFHGMVSVDHVDLETTSGTTGRMRMTRVGSLLSGYFHNGATWVLIGSGTASTAPTRVALELGTGDPAALAGRQAALDDFKATAGEIICSR